MKNKYISADDALAKLQRYCAYQDRCHKEVRSKLLDLGQYGDTLEEIMAELISENFLNEERYARSYARGKFRIKRWGRNKIKRELKLKSIAGYCLRKAMEEIDSEEYETVLTQILNKKMLEYARKTTNVFQQRQKAALYAINRGYESALVWELLKKIDLNPAEH